MTAADAFEADPFAALRTDTIGRDIALTTPFGARQLLYADFIASGRSLHSIERTIAETVLPLYANSHTEDSATGAVTTHLLHDADRFVKECVHAGTEHKLVWCGNGSTAAIKRLQEILGVAIPSPLRRRVLDTMRADERPVVFVGPYEHHSNEVTWRETLVEVVEIPLCPAGQCDLAALEAALADPRWQGRSKIGSFSAASNVTGICTDTRAIARILHAHDALACFDFAASAPYVDIDMRAGQDDRYDAIFVSAHKFLGGPGTPGILIFDEGMYTLDAPSTGGGGTVAYVSTDRHRFLTDIEAREDAGTPAILQRIRAALAFGVKERIGVGAIAAREEALLGRALERLRADARVELLGDVDAPRLAVLSFLLRPEVGGPILHPRLVVRLLNDLFGIQARGGCACAGPYGHRLLNIGHDLSERYMDEIDAGHEGLKPGWTRISLHYTLTDDELECIVDAVAWIAAHGAALVPAYELDWVTGAWTHGDDDTDGLKGLRFTADGLCGSRAPGVPSSGDVRTRFAGYLAEADRIAADIAAAGHVMKALPADIPGELVYFAR